HPPPVIPASSWEQTLTGAARLYGNPTLGKHPSESWGRRQSLSPRDPPQRKLGPTSPLTAPSTVMAGRRPGRSSSARVQFEGHHSTHRSGGWGRHWRETRRGLRPPKVTKTFPR